MSDTRLAPVHRDVSDCAAASTAARISSSTRRRQGLNPADRLIARRSPFLLWLYGKFCRRDLANYFHRVRLLGELPASSGPIVLCLNHPSWWDVEVYGWLTTTVFASHLVYAPVDAPNLRRYSILERFGAFAVHANSTAGAYAFLSVAETVLQKPNGLMMVAVEGRYRDVRERPVRPMAGLGHLAKRAPAATFIPVALEYVFWSERRPNLLMSFGTPISGGELAALKPSQATARIASALEDTMCTLAEASRSRDAGRFSILIKGRDGMSAIVDLWRRSAALRAGARFQKAHRDEAGSHPV